MLKLHSLIEKIYGQYEEAEASAVKRTHLGASVIGDKCKRHVFFEFRWYMNKEIEGRILRLFDTGKREEARVLENLIKLGFKLRKTEDDGQIKFIDKSGHIGGSVDGIIDYIPPEFGFTGPCILEIKTHSDKNFRKFIKEKVETAFPKHYHQMQYYMGALGIPYSLYIGINKNTDEIYMEMVEFDEFGFLYLKGKAEVTITSQEPPAKISDSPAWFECKMCKFHSICHEGEKPNTNCRTCKHAIPVEGGQWGCKLLNISLPYEKQVNACEKHEPLL